MGRKTRSDARLPKLTPEQRETVLGWFEENLALKEMVRLIYSEFDISTNADSLSKWYSSYALSVDIRDAALLAGNLREQLEDLPIKLEDDFISRAVQAKFEKEVAERGDLEGHVLLRKLRQKDQDQRLAERAQASSETGFKLKFEQKEREIALQREKFKRDTCELFLTWYDDERAKAITTSGATNAEKIEQLGQAMFGEDWTQ